MQMFILLYSLHVHVRMLVGSALVSCRVRRASDRTEKGAGAHLSLETSRGAHVSNYCFELALVNLKEVTTQGRI